MQNLRFRRYADVFKICHELSKEKTNLYRVFYEKSVSNLVSPQLRRDLIQYCYPDFFMTPQLVMQGISKDESGADLFCYFIIMEANYDPYTVTERFQKLLIDSVFDAARHELIGKKDKDAKVDKSTRRSKIWSRISCYLAKYFKAI
jgi:hypothetical protein